MPWGAIVAAGINYVSSDRAGRRGEAAANNAADAQAQAQIRAGELSLEGAHIAAGAQIHAAELMAAAQAKAVREQRRQFDYSKELLQPFVDMGQGSISDVQEASTIAGLNRRLGQIQDTRSFNELVDMRSDQAQSHLASVGSRRSGAAVREAAQIPTDLALSIEGVLNDRSTNLVASSQNAAANLGGFAINSGNAVAQTLLSGASQQGQFVAGAGAAHAQGLNAMANAQLGAGQARASGIIGAQQARSAGYMGMANAVAGGINAYGQMQNQGLTYGGSSNGSGGSGLSFGDQVQNFFTSDERLKKNFKKRGEIGGLTIWSWDWKEPVAKHLSKITTGFKAQEVKKKYPQFVKTVNGFLGIDYQGLHNHMVEEGLV